MIKTFGSAVFGLAILLATGAGVAQSSDAPQEIVTDLKDPCVQAAVSRTNEEFPIDRTVERSFFFWTSDDTGTWKPHKDLVNKGVDPASAKYIDIDAFDAEIENTYTTTTNADAPRKKLIREQITKGREILRVEFNFGGGRRLARHFVIVRKVNPKTCIVQHTDAKLDELTGGGA